MKKVFRRTVVSTLLLALVFAGIWSVKVWSQTKQDEVLAKVGDVVITSHDLDEMVKKYQAVRKGKPFGTEEKKWVLDTLVKSVLIAQEAEKLKLDKTPDVQAKLKIAKIEVLTREYITTQAVPKVKVTDQEVEDYMKQFPDLIPKESLMLREVVVKTEEEAKDVVKELKKGTSVTKLANERSIDPGSKRYGGQMQPVSKGSGKLPGNAEEAVFKLKVGEFTSPIKTDKGWVVFFLEERKERSPKEVEQLTKKVKEKVEKIVQGNKLEAIVDGIVGEVSKQTKVEKHYDRIR